MKCFLVRRQRLGQLRGRFVGFFRRRATHHHGQHVVELRKFAVERHGVLAPRQRAGEEVVGIGVDAQLARGDPDGDAGQGEKEHCHQQCIAAAELDNSDDELSHGPNGSSVLGKTLRIFHNASFSLRWE